MPLIQSPSRAAVSTNIARELGAGKPRAQAIAIALDVARRNRAAGGQLPWFVRNQAHGMTHTGPIMSSVPGRTDHHAIKVPAGSYVLPSEHVSSLGEGNTVAGMKVLTSMFGPSKGPYGSGAMPLHAGRRGKLAEGGVAEDGGSPVDIMAAGGEFVIPPEKIIEMFGDLKKGHRFLDAWVMKRRQEHIKTLENLPPPAKD